MNLKVTIKVEFSDPNRNDNPSWIECHREFDPENAAVAGPRYVTSEHLKEMVDSVVTSLEQLKVI